jgi:hypothetical protein
MAGALEHPHDEHVKHALEGFAVGGPISWNDPSAAAAGAMSAAIQRGGQFG